MPWRRTRDPYAILVSEMMLQQTQVVTVLGYYARWMELFPTIPVLAAAEESAVLHAWQGLGYYSRARNLHQAARAVMARHGGELPRALAELRALPGVGRYTAGAVATFAFDVATPIVDANIARVVARLFDVREAVDGTAGAARVWNLAEALQPRRGAGEFNAALMELGALICTPRSPQCAVCPVAEFCAAPVPEDLPVKRARPTVIAVESRCGFIRRGGRVLLEQEQGRQWRGLWRLPTLVRSPAGEPILRAQFSITRHRVSLAIFPAAVPAILGANQRWCSRAEADALAMPSPHRRALAALWEQTTRPAISQAADRPLRRVPPHACSVCAPAPSSASARSRRSPRG